MPQCSLMGDRVMPNGRGCCRKCGRVPAYPLASICKGCHQRDVDRTIDEAIRMAGEGERQFPSYRHGLPLPGDYDFMTWPRFPAGGPSV